MILSKSALNSENTISVLPEWDLSILKEKYTIKIVKEQRIFSLILRVGRPFSSFGDT